MPDVSTTKIVSIIYQKGVVSNDEQARISVFFFSGSDYFNGASLHSLAQARPFFLGYVNLCTHVTNWIKKDMLCSKTKRDQKSQGYRDAVVLGEV